jgi:hypothetical protein
MKLEAEIWVKLINTLNWHGNNRFKRRWCSQGVWEAYIIPAGSFNKRKGTLFRVVIRYISLDLATEYFKSEKMFGVTPLKGHSPYEALFDIDYQEPPIKYSTKRLEFRDGWTKTSMTKDEIEEAIVAFFLTLDPYTYNS